MDEVRRVLTMGMLFKVDYQCLSLRYKPMRISMVPRAHGTQLLYIVKFCWFLLWGVLLVGCHSQKGVIVPATNLSIATLTPGEPHLLLLIGTISYDSLKATYQLDFTSEKCVDGYVNINDANPDSTGLHYVQLGKDQTVLSRHAIENPLRRDMEYLGQMGYGHKVTILPKADIYIRIQMDKNLQEIEFRNGQQIIKRLSINN